ARAPRPLDPQAADARPDRAEVLDVAGGADAGDVARRRHPAGERARRHVALALEPVHGGRADLGGAAGPGRAVARAGDAGQRRVSRRGDQDGRGRRVHRRAAGNAQQPGRLLRRGNRDQPRAVHHGDRAAAAGRHGDRDRRAAALAVSPALQPVISAQWLMDDKNSAAHAELYADHSVVAEQSAAELAAEMEQGRRLAERHRLPFLDLAHFNIDHDLFRTIPAELMLRYGFVPYRREGNALAIVVSDPTDLPMIDELGMLLGTPIKVMVAPASAIQAILKKSESSTRVLEDATESFQLQILREDEQGEDQLTVEKLTTDTSPVIRLVDTTIYTAIQRRASDIHIETADDAVYVKYRIDGVLQSAMRPIDKRFHSTIISRIKVMAELDIAEKRVPQDGRFKLRLAGKTIDFRVSVMPSAHGEDAVIRILDKESISEQFTELRLDILGFPDDELRRFRKYIRE